MTTTAHEDQYTVAPEPVRQPYDTVAILRRNVADLELALRTQTERAEAAEEEMAKLAKQEPVAYVKYKATGGNVGLAWMAIPTAAFYPREGEKLYVTPVPAPHKGATHCDGCGLTWLDDGLNPLGCPYCKDTVPAPAAPTNTIPEGDDFNGTTPHMIRCIESLVAMNDRGALAPHGLCGHSRTLLLASANRLRQQQAPAVPELDPMTRLIVSDPKQLKPKKQEPAVPSVVFMAHNKTSNILFAARKDADQYAAAAGPTAGVAITECAVIGSQSAPQAPAVSAANPVQWLEDEGDMILVPRGLLGAACSSIDKQRPAPKVLEAMRHYTMNAPQAPAVPTDEQIHVVYRNARRYLALRETGVVKEVIITSDNRLSTVRMCGNDLDAAADRLLEGGK